MLRFCHGILHCKLTVSLVSTKSVFKCYKQAQCSVKVSHLDVQAEYERERAAVDEIMRRIDAEDALEEAQRRRQQAASRDYIQQFLQVRPHNRADRTGVCGWIGLRVAA